MSVRDGVGEHTFLVFQKVCLLACHPMTFLQILKIVFNDDYIIQNFRLRSLRAPGLESQYPGLGCGITVTHSNNFGEDTARVDKRITPTGLVTRFLGRSAQNWLG